MGLRTFTCKLCGGQWKTESLGRFIFCDPCKILKKEESHDKICVECKMPFVDPSIKNCTQYCSDVCRKRAKGARLGLPEGYFLFDREMECITPGCGVRFTPKRANQIFCTLECRDSTVNKPVRRKVCAECGESFFDDSLKNNRQSHQVCPVDVPIKPKLHSPHLEYNRQKRVEAGQGGRIDQIETLTKYTSTWWGRVGELIFSAYKPLAKDLNVLNGGRSPYDFEDPDLGRVDVKTSRGRISPEGRLMWCFQFSGERNSCDHGFLIGLSQDCSEILRLWVVPQAALNLSLMRMAPGSKDYQGGQRDVSQIWGLDKGTRVLKDCLSLGGCGEVSFEDTKENLSFYQGRRGEMFYSFRYPSSRDMNKEVSGTHPYDFEDSDGTRVDVKTSKPHYQDNGLKWSFTLLSPKKLKKGHQCEVYSCLCLSDNGKSVLKEYRIPVSVLGARRAIHIYDKSGGQWGSYLVDAVSL